MTPLFRLAPALALLLAATAFHASGAHWPQFRGPTRQGVSAETSAPLEWSATSNVVWKAAIPGVSWSSPIVWDRRVYLTTATDDGQTGRVLALDTATGNVVWNTAVIEQVPRRKEDRNSYATPTPATDGERVYVCFGDGSFAALNLDGGILWTNRNYPFYSQHGLGTSAILHDGLLIMARDGSSEGPDKNVGWRTAWDRAFVIALDARTGQERWKTARGLSRISHGAPNIWEGPEGPQVISEAGDVVQGFDLKSGKRLWSSTVTGEGKVPSMVLGEGLVFTTGGWGGKDAIQAFRPGGSGDLQESNLVWEQKKGTPKIPSMVHVAPYLYAMTDGGIATCLKAATGEIVWQERVGGNFSASLIAVAGRLYCTSDEGLTTVLALGPEFKILARNPVGERVQASAAIADGRFYLRTQSTLFCLGNPK